MSGCKNALVSVHCDYNLQQFKILCEEQSLRFTFNREKYYCGLKQTITLLHI